MEHERAEQAWKRQQKSELRASQLEGAMQAAALVDTGAVKDKRSDDTKQDKRRKKELPMFATTGETLRSLPVWPPSVPAFPTRR